MDTGLHQNPYAAMHGYPVPESQRVGPGNWAEQPWLRWSLLNRDRMLPAVAVWRGEGPVLPMSRANQPIGGIAFGPVPGTRTTVAEALEATETDAFLVMHRGRILHETYLHGMRPEQRHYLASISKSFLGLLAAMLAEQKVLDLSRTAASYVPELAQAGVGPATLQQLLDMSAGVERGEMANRPGSIGGKDGGVYEAVGLLPLVEGSPSCLTDVVLARARTSPPGSTFYYDNSQTETIAWVIRRVCGRDIASLISEMIWAPLGVERDASYLVDRAGVEFTAGGLSVTLRDLARFGEMMRLEGQAGGRAVVPPSVVAEIRRGGNAALFNASQEAANNPGGSYRDFWFLTHGRHEAMMCVGRYGQRLWVSPKAELVIAQFSSVPGAPPDRNGPARRRMYEAITDQFMPA